jgi:hypothetical protein
MPVREPLLKRIVCAATLVILILLSTPLSVRADDGTLYGMERRRDQFSKDFSYFFYPISGKAPGIGTAYGAGATVANIAGTDTDFTGFYVRGDFEASGAVIANYHLIEERLILDIANYTAKVAPQSYKRGMDSDKEDVIHLEVQSEVSLAQLSGTFFQRMLEVYGRGAFGSQKLNRVLDSQGNEFSNADKSTAYFQGLSLGFTVDVTDDRQDPRKGLRFEMKDRITFFDRKGSSDYDTLDANLTYYHPVGASSVWAFNAFYSTALVKSKGETDRETLKRNKGLQCQTIPDPVGRAQCEATERKYLDEVIAENTCGRATGLGGTQRLRSYPMERFYAGQTVFYGTEFRWNLTEESTLMDWYILRGLRTNIQLALFAEAGSVSDVTGDLHKNLRASYGAGLRILFSGATIRLDFATGDEGQEMQLFLDYPWSVFSVDRVT